MYEDMPKILGSVLVDLDNKKEKALAAEGVAKIIERITEFINEGDADLVAYAAIYDDWRGYRGKIQINGIENMKTQIPPIIAEFAKAGYRVKKWDDSPQSAMRTYYLCRRDNEKIQDIYIAAYLANNTSQCKYVQVGTKTKTEAVYELRCNDALDSPEPQPEPGEAVESDNNGGKQREPEGGEQSGTECGDSTDSANLSEGLQPESEAEGTEDQVDAEGSLECGEE